METNWIHLESFVFKKYKRTRQSTLVMTELYSINLLYYDWIDASEYEIPHLDEHIIRTLSPGHAVSYYVNTTSSAATDF